ncbi:lamin tail domain-containing protein, partial [bacterium]|nr:lamin tail domain-containing protein [bacterium]
MKRIAIVLLAGVLLIGATLPSNAIQYEPPVNIVFIIHIEPLGWPMAYQERMDFLAWLQELAQTRPIPFKMTILVNGDIAEYAVNNGDIPFFQSLEADGHEVGTHAHSIVQTGPYEWVSVDSATQRYGIPIYSQDATEQVWSDAKSWVDMLTPNNNSICAFPFICSAEGGLMLDNGFLASPGNRSEKGLDYTGFLLHHPFRPASDNRLGHEMEEDFNGSHIYVDHYAQIGNPDAHGYNCTAQAMAASMDEAYQEWLIAEQMEGDSLDHKIWTFGFLTHLWIDNAYYRAQITQLIELFDSLYVDQYTPRGNLIAQYATVNEVTNDFIDWETTHPGESSFSYVHDFPTEPLINEAMIIPADSSHTSEWIEVFNPTDQWLNISGFEINDGLIYATDFWRFPPSTWLGPLEFATVAMDGNSFRADWGFRPDFEVFGNTGARPLYSEGYYTLHDLNDGCVIRNNDTVPTGTNTAITDGLSWGDNYVTGFTLPVPTAGSTYGRDGNSTDTGYAYDWSLNGEASSPTPGGHNVDSYFDPQIKIFTEVAWVPMTIPETGGSVEFSIQFINEYASIQVVDIWTNLLLPNGSVYGPLIIREDRGLNAGLNITVDLVQVLPAGAP